ncbi:hypothetical protein BDV36DRAFT_255483, partial [Aspergillus pseudocaelatus]
MRRREMIPFLSSTLSMLVRGWRGFLPHFAFQRRWELPVSTADFIPDVDDVRARLHNSCLCCLWGDICILSTFTLILSWLINRLL